MLSPGIPTERWLCCENVIRDIYSSIRHMEEGSEGAFTFGFPYRPKPRQNQSLSSWPDSAKLINEGFSGLLSILGEERIFPCQQELPTTVKYVKTRKLCSSG